MPKAPKRGLGELRSFKDEARARRDEITTLENKNQLLQEEIELLKNKCKSIESLNRQVAESKSNELGRNQNQMERLESELRDAKLESNKRVSDTTQFQQMMKLMKSQVRV